MARVLAEAGFTVVSGLARGIDSAAHLGALEAGGRTVAVLGTGIERMYPAENAALAERIAGSGGLVSQFWPTAGPTRTTFPMRNAVSAGLALATVVVEASATSGARHQARLALGQGRLVVLPDELVGAEAWARAVAARNGVAVVGDLGGLVGILDRQARLEATTKGQPSPSVSGPEQLRLL